MQNILITGASSGIGQALALRYARDGASLVLLGRSASRLDAVAAECRSLGATVEIAVLDVRDRPRMFEVVEAFDRTRPVDVLFANAGVMEGTPLNGEIEAPDAAHTLMQINVGGVLNTVQPILPGMMARGRGQIVIVSSIAAFVPLADSPSYCASKAAVLSYGLSLRSLLARRGIRVNVVCPGYIATPMLSRESGPRPFEMAPERAVEIIRRGLARDKAVIAFPRLFALATRINGLLPDRLRRSVLRKFRFTVSDPE